MNTRTKLVTFTAVAALMITGIVAIELVLSTATSAQRYPTVGGKGSSGDTKAGINNNITSSGNITSNTRK
jgi:hypothetical protein